MPVAVFEALLDELNSLNISVEAVRSIANGESGDLLAAIDRIDRCSKRSMALIRSLQQHIAPD